jgi:hypothetical protein
MSNEPVTVEDQPSSPQQGISAVEENQQQQEQQQQQQAPHEDVGPNMPQPPTQRSNTGNQIPTDSELEQQQQGGNNTEAQANTNNLGFPVVPKQHIQQQQAPPKSKVDHSQTDATIQGLLVQVIALQHNKIQQIAQQQE